MTLIELLSIYQLVKKESSSWKPTDDLCGIEWDGGEKFYDYVEWLDYIIANFLEPWGYTLNGSVKWRGESFDDIGIIEVRHNDIFVKDVNW